MDTHGGHGFRVGDEGVLLLVTTTVPDRPAGCKEERLHLRETRLYHGMQVHGYATNDPDLNGLDNRIGFAYGRYRDSLRHR